MYTSQVLGLTADGAQSNRLFSFMLNPDASRSSHLTYKVPNPYTTEDRPILIFSDPPHLIKTIRNCLYNKRRNLSVSLNCN